MFSSDKNLYVGYVMPLDAQPQRTGSICDDNVDLVCADAGINGFNFVCYPVAGVSRASQYSSADFQSGDEQGSSKKHVADLPPVHVNLSDIQMGKSRCTNYINGFTSPWIDCDNPNTEFAKYSIKQLDTCVSFQCFYAGIYVEIF